ncbi:MAG: family 10 glycosylhydrolase [Chloroflexi bacterium]|nr:family 10 glycosylhydrolase [Chloroflexota bacterium]
MKKRPIWIIVVFMSILVLGTMITAVITQAQQSGYTYLPIIQKPEATPTPSPTPSPTSTPSPTPSPTPDPSGMVELRGMWVTRFDWTSYSSAADPAKIDEIVNNAAYAGFNAIFFQVRGIGDAYYQSNVEPWASRISGVGLGVAPNPYWDPLADLISKAHAQNIQVHAYINVYPVWNGSQCDDPPDPAVLPQHIYWKLLNAHGNTSGKNNGLIWNTSGQVSCGTYMRATPASIVHDDHLMSVATDIVTRYDVDGLHLDHIRYDRSTSCDPVSAAAAGVPCFSFPPAGYNSYQDWQRAQVNGTVFKFYDQIVPLKPGLWLSAAVWPLYIDYWGWGGTEGHHDYYQDSKAWVGGGYIDSISPMIYGGTVWDTGATGRVRWQMLVQDFQNDSHGRYIIPGIGADYSDFYDIESRIQMARQIGTAGHALFSYGALNSHSYFDDLRNGPYADTAVPPTIPWHP